MAINDGICSPVRHCFHSSLIQRFSWRGDILDVTRFAPSWSCYGSRSSGRLPVSAESSGTKDPLVAGRRITLAARLRATAGISRLPTIAVTSARAERMNFTHDPRLRSSVTSQLACQQPRGRRDSRRFSPREQPATHRPGHRYALAQPSFGSAGLVAAARGLNIAPARTELI